MIKTFKERVLDNLWNKVAHPKLWTIAMVSIYAILIGAWIPALIKPPGSLEGVVGLASMYLIASLIIVGAVTGIPSALIARFSVERWSVVCVGVGIIMYVVIIGILHWSSEGNRLPQGGTIAALLPTMIARWVHVTRRPIGEDEEAIIHSSTRSHVTDEI